MKRFLFLSLILMGQGSLIAAPAAPPAIEWHEWSDTVFAQAKKENRFVLLDLEAVWCHWCHVMDAKTYSNPKVISLIGSRYIAVRVDQDSRPDLSNRYEDYGWPATVVFDANGGEIVKRQGFIPPEQMSSMLQAIIDDPTPGPSVKSEAPIEYSRDALIPEAMARGLREKLDAGYDGKLGAWGGTHKFLDWDNVEYCMERAQAGDSQARKMAAQTLDAERQLIDPVWGGVYQYSAEGDWKHPHFEKIMQMQAENLRIYALAYAVWKNPAWLQAAGDIHRYLLDFLRSPDGAFYTSQDADLVPGSHSAAYFQLDDAARRKLGVPRVDRHIYARENGWFIEALVQFYSATGEPQRLHEAEGAAAFILAERALPGGGFKHGAEDGAPLCLGDTLYMGRAFLSLYEATGERKWLKNAEDAARFIGGSFSPKDEAGFNTAKAASQFISPKPNFDENVDLARFANLLFHYTDDARDREIAARAMRFLVTPRVVAGRQSYVGGLLLAGREFSTDPLHITVVGPKEDPAARGLFLAALEYPRVYKRLEWIDPKDLGGTPIAYPSLPQAAAFICTNTTCSPPIYKPEQIALRIDKLAVKEFSAKQ